MALRSHPFVAISRRPVVRELWVLRVFCALRAKNRLLLRSTVKCAGHVLFTLMLLLAGVASPAKPLRQSPLGTAGDPEAELQTGISLTRAGNFAEAIPHFLAAQGRVKEDYAAKFNLALCYVGTSQFPQAIQILSALESSGPGDANVESLLAQAYVGSGDADKAFAALNRAAALSPKSEKLYLLVADAAGDRQNYALGLRIIHLALQNLPDSARLHYQRAYFLAMLDEFDAAKPDFDRAAALAPKSEIAYLAAAQKSYFAGDMPDAIRSARAAVQEGHANYLLLTILGDALLRSGASPGDASFAEARAALEKAVALRPAYITAQLTLGSLLLVDNQIAPAVDHLERARQLDPRNPSVYAHLAIAYRKAGKPQQSDAMLAVLAQLNAEQAAKINAAPGERKAIPGSSAGIDRPKPQPI